MSAMEGVQSAVEVDASLYSRQIFALGFDAMRRMAVSNVLVVGLRGLGVEIGE